MPRKKRAVQEMVDAELVRDPRVSLEDLHFLAGRMDAGVEKMSLGDFAALYVGDRQAAEAPSKPVRKRGTKKRGTKKRTTRKASSKKTTRKAAPKKKATGKKTTRKRSTKKATTRKTTTKSPSSRKGSTRKRGAAKKRASKKRTSTRKSAAAAAARPMTGSPDVERVRGILHDFAQELAGATDPAQAVAVMARVDDYVEKILKG
jgi:hypothetical protein